MVSRLLLALSRAMCSDIQTVSVFWSATTLCTAGQASKWGQFPVSARSHFTRVTLHPTSGCDTRGVLNLRRGPDCALLKLRYLHDLQISNWTLSVV